MSVQKINYNSANFSNQKQPSFKATIRYVSGIDFKRILRQLPYAFEAGDCENYTMYTSVVKKPSAFTTGAFNCVIGTIFNPETKLTNMFHLAPSKNYYNIDSIKNELFRQATELKGDSSVNLEGFLTGGNAYMSLGSWDMAFVQAIKDIFSDISKKIGMDCTMITERFDNYIGVNVISNARVNTHYVNVTRSYADIVPDNLYKIFKTVKISPKDTVEIEPSLLLPKSVVNI